MTSKAELNAAVARGEEPAGPSTGAASADPHDAPGDALAWDRLVTEFLEAYWKANPHLAVDAGRHEFDGQLPDWSAEGLAASMSRLRELGAAAAAFDGSRLDPRRRFERRHLLARVERELFWVETAEWPRRNPHYYITALDPTVYAIRPYAPVDERMRAFIAYARRIPAAAEQIRANLPVPLPATHARMGDRALRGLAAFFETDIGELFGTVRHEGLQAELRSASDPAIEALVRLADALSSDEGNEEAGYAIGADLLGEMLRRTEGVDLTLDAVEEAGREDLRRNLEALERACAESEGGSSVERCVERVRSAKPPEGPLAATRQALVRLRRHTEAAGLVTIPPGANVDVAEAPRFMGWNPACIGIPGPFEADVPGTLFIAPPDAEWSDDERRAYLPSRADLTSIAAHEVWPGHYLQFRHARDCESQLGRVLIGYAFAEGWAHYSEELVVEAGLADEEPEARIAQILNALLRNVRLVVAIGLHARGMELDEAARLFRTHAFLDVAGARQQAARGAFDPAYLKYTLGKLIIRKLRDDWTAERGGRAAWREFHDRLLSYGSPPISLVRNDMIGPAGGSDLL